jgi:thiol-disulfide isomerase/thioredoxin
MKRPKFYVVLFALITAGAVSSGREPQQGGKAEGEQTQKQQEGKSQSLQSTASAKPGDVVLQRLSLEEILAKIKKPQEKWTIVDVWSTSCAPCMREFPKLVELSKRYPDKLRCMSINVDYLGMKSKPPENYEPKVKKFLATQNANFDHFLSTTPDSELFEKMEIDSIPAIMIFDASGERKMLWTDSNSGDDGLSYEGDVIPWLEKQWK